MVASSDDLAVKALKLFEQSLDHPSTEREIWIRQNTENNEALRAKALSYLARDAEADQQLRTGGAFHDTIDDTVLPEKIGAYTITGLIGKGGMGAVYRGERDQQDFDHEVAIKVIRLGVMSEKLIARFEEERRTLASLSHPNIARLYDGGTLSNHTPYFVMEYIDGLPISEWADKNALSLDQRLALFQSTCEAVSYAHQRLIVHRDITPSNVLVDGNGIVKLIDFGIARDFGEDHEAGDTGHSLASLSFTPGYSAPERQSGVGASTLSDIYSLGKLLAHLVAQNNISDELQAIIAKATNPTPQDRYQTVNMLMSDIAYSQKGFPVSALPVSSLQRFGKFMSRHKVGTGLAFIALTGLVSAFILTTIQYQRAEAARIEATQRFSETRELTGFLLNDLGDDLNALPGTLPIYRKVTEVSSEYLSILAAAAEADPELELDYAKGAMQLARLLTQSGGPNLGEPEEGIRNLDISIEILTRLAAAEGASIEVRKLLADAVIDRAYLDRFYFDDFDKLEQAIAIAKPIYDNILLEDSENKQVRTALLDIRFEQWMASLKNRPATLDAELLQLKTDLEAAFSDDLANDDFIISYGSFLYIAASKVSAQWEEKGNFVPLSESKDYETLLAWAAEGFAIVKDKYKANPSNPEDMYTYFWALESYVAISTMKLEWRLTPEEIAAQIVTRPWQSREKSIQRILEKDKETAKGLALANELKEHLAVSDILLERLEPFDAGTYSHSQAIYSTYKNRALINGRLLYVFDEAEENLRIATTMPDQYLEFDPENERVRLESIFLRTALIDLLKEKEILFETDHKDEICQILVEAGLYAENGTFEDTKPETVARYLSRIVVLQEENECGA